LLLDLPRTTTRLVMWLEAVGYGYLAQVRAGASDRGGNKRAAPPTSVSHRLLADLVWIELVMCRLLLVPIADRSDALRHVETLAGHVADLLVREGCELSPDNTSVATAREVLDLCCWFIEQWKERTADGATFQADVRRLRARLDDMLRQLACEDVATEQKAS
jgi:hypothetical protein